MRIEAEFTDQEVVQALRKEKSYHVIGDFSVEVPAQQWAIMLEKARSFDPRTEFGTQDRASIDREVCSRIRSLRHSLRERTKQIGIEMKVVSYVAEEFNRNTFYTNLQLLLNYINYELRSHHRLIQVAIQKFALPRLTADTRKQLWSYGSDALREAIFHYDGRAETKFSSYALVCIYKKLYIGYYKLAVGSDDEYYGLYQQLIRSQKDMALFEKQLGRELTQSEQYLVMFLREVKVKQRSEESKRKVPLNERTPAIVTYDEFVATHKIFQRQEIEHSNQTEFNRFRKRMAGILGYLFPDLLDETILEGDQDEDVSNERLIEVLAWLDEELKSIDGRWAKVLKMRVIDQMTLNAIGKHFGVGRERIRQIKAEAIRKIHRDFVLYFNMSFSEYLQKPF